VTLPLIEQLREQYQTLFDTCRIVPARLSMVRMVAQRITANEARYQAVAGPLGIPWYFLGLVHSMESSLNFHTHLHNGDPLDRRTTHVPSGRPTQGEPPFTWEQSATDAMWYERLTHLADWSLPALLYRLEGYNGYGYHALTPPVNSPYLWGFSNHYTSGKYVADHIFDRSAVSQQCGAATLLRQMVLSDTIQL